MNVMKEKLKNFKFLEVLIKTFNILFILSFCWVFTDAMAHVFQGSPLKSTIYAIMGGLYIGAYGVMTSQMWIDQLKKDCDKKE